MFLTLILLNLLVFGDASRHKRYLVYPDGGPARAQFIIGLGIPVDLKEASVTVGTVIKFQYDLPTNSTEYTSRIYGFADTVSRDMNGETSETEENGNDIETDDARDMGKANDDLENENDNDNDTLIDITFNEKRKRSLVYTEGGTINELEELGINTELPLDEAIRRQEMLDQKVVDEELEPQRMNRWDFYKIFEHMIERYGFSGRPCLLRTICEAASVPFTYEHGLLGEIGHILFTNWDFKEIPHQFDKNRSPSTTKDILSHHSDNEFHAAERLGREIGVDCETLFPECESSILETFTGIGIDTLHKFGLY